MRQIFRNLALLLLVAFLPVAGQEISFQQLNQDAIEARLQRLASKNEDRKTNLRSLFEEAGCAQLSEQAVKGSRIPNVICELPGSGPDVIVVGAHFDKVQDGHGIVDNWSGSSLLPSLYEALSSEERCFSFRFIGFTDEERGMVGSNFYVKDLPEEERKRIAAMVNIDCLGLSITRVWASRADKQLLAHAVRVSQLTKLPLGGVNIEIAADSDSRAFIRAKIPTIDFHSITQETISILHSDADKPSAIRIDDYYQSYVFVAAYLALLDFEIGTPPQPAPRP